MAEKSVEIDIPTPLIEQIKSGGVILFLGAGVNANASHPDKQNIPLSSEQLATFLCETFFNCELTGRSLFDIAKFAESEFGLPVLQQALLEKFQPFTAAEYHKKVCQFPWHAIATTNYDLIIEDAYLQAPDYYRILPIYKDSNGIDRQLKKNPGAIPYLKLHGCISKIDDAEIPLIITPEQYLRYKKNRARLFDALRGWAQDFCVLFAGYSIGDPHIAQIIMDLEDQSISRPRYYSISPNANDYDIRYWGDRKVEILKIKFEDFLNKLEAKIDRSKLKIATLQKNTAHSVTRFYTSTNLSISARLSTFLEADVDHVVANMATKGNADAKEFYAGNESGWEAIEAEFDIPRRVSDDVLAEQVISEVESEAESGVNLTVIKGPAGNGKTIALKRIAWDAANDYEKFVLVLKNSGSIDPDAILEILVRTTRRLFLIVDHCALHHEEIADLYRRSVAEGYNLSIITAERDHEWSTYCSDLQDLPHEEYPIRYLSENEIHLLLKKLDTHGCLGVLHALSYEDRFSAFYQHAGRQLLVALYELTSGKSFEDIVFDEYQRILPREAKYLYLDVCSLNRFSVPVRAGTISRVSNISFSDFKDKLFAPLKNVVHSYYDKNIRDFVYTARHADVARMVFDRVLETPEAKFNQMIRVLSGVNLSFSTDVMAFREIIQSSGVIDTFPSVELAHRFYDKAIEVTGENNEYVYQQAAIFELNHKGGNVGRAYLLLKEALRIAPHESTIKHTYANLRRRQALEAKTALEATTLRNEARSILNDLKKRNKSQVYEFHTLAQLDLDELIEALKERSGTGSEDGPLDRRIAELISEAEKSLQVGMQKFPDSQQLLALEANFRDLLSQDSRSEQALRKAFELNVRQEFIAVRLSRYLVSSGKQDEGVSVLQRCLEANPSAKFAHLEYAKLLLMNPNSDRSLTIAHLRRSTTTGDSNYFARFLLATQLLFEGEEEEAATLFESLEKAPISNVEKRKIRSHWKNESGDEISFLGQIEAIKDNFCFVRIPNLKRPLFSYYADSDPAVWKALRNGSDVDLTVGLTMRGPVAVDLKPHQ